MVQKICDRCGKIITEKDHMPGIFISNLGDTWDKTPAYLGEIEAYTKCGERLSIDLCNDCKQGIIDFLKREDEQAP